MSGASLLLKKCCCGGVPGPAAWRLTPCYESAIGTCCPSVGDPTPKYLTVTFQGIEWVMTCTGEDTIIANPTPDSLNHSFVLGPLYYAGGCSWTNAEYEEMPTVGSVETPCSGEQVTTPIRIQIAYAVTKSGTAVTRRLRIYVQAVPWEGDDFDSGYMVEDPMPDCDTRYRNSNGYEFINTSETSGLLSGGSARIQSGDIYNPNIACPGGSPIYTDDMDVAAYEGGTVKLDDGVCYTVEANPDANVSDGDVTVVSGSSEDTCADCCAT